MGRSSHWGGIAARQVCERICSEQVLLDDIGGSTRLSGAWREDKFGKFRRLLIVENSCSQEYQSERSVNVSRSWAWSQTGCCRCYAQNRKNAISQTGSRSKEGRRCSSSSRKERRCDKRKVSWSSSQIGERREQREKLRCKQRCPSSWPKGWSENWCCDR